MKIGVTFDVLMIFRYPQVRDFWTYIDLRLRSPGYPITIYLLYLGWLLDNGFVSYW